MSDNIVEFRNPQFPLHVRKTPQCSCKWQFIGCFLNEHQRTLECKQCGAILDPIDYLLRLAQEGEQLSSRIKEQREQIIAHRGQISMLEDEIKALRAQGRKLKQAVPVTPDKVVSINSDSEG